MKNTSVFQVLVLIFSGVFAIIAIIMFSMYKGSGEDKLQPVTVWGTIPSDSFDDLIVALREDKEMEESLDHVTYIEKDLSTFDAEFVESLAVGNGPDLVILPHERILRQKNKLVSISYETYPERLFQDSFIEGADILRDENGIYAFPLTVDPLVMYWNRDLFTKNLITEAPKVWETVLDISPKLSITDDAGNIFQSAVAMGQFSNIDYAKEILTTLIKQAGGDVVRKLVGASDGRTPGEDYYISYIPSLNFRGEYLTPPAESALRFFGQFTDPTREVYSWNKSLSSDSQRFLSGDLAIYFGKSSRYFDFKKINPNLNFDVAPLPQKTGTTPITYGDFTGISIVKNSSKITDSFNTLLIITKPEVANLLSSIINLPPARRDVLSQTQPESYNQTFFSSAIWTKVFFDPYPEQTDKIFEDMIRLYTSGQSGLGGAIDTANNQLEVLYE